MLLKREYFADLKELIRETPEEVFAKKSVERYELLDGNNDAVATLWVLFQKNREEYEMDADAAYQEALKDLFGIDYHKQTSESEDGWIGAKDDVPPIPTNTITMPDGSEMYQQYMCLVDTDAGSIRIPCEFLPDGTWLYDGFDITSRVVRWQPLVYARA